MCATIPGIILHWRRSEGAARQIVRLPQGNQRDVLEAIRREALSSAELGGVVDLWLRCSERRQQEYLLAHPREALSQAKVVLPAVRDPRLSEAGNQVWKRVGMLLDVLGRMEVWLAHQGRNAAHELVAYVGRSIVGEDPPRRSGRAGYRNVVALMGSSLSDTQAGLLQKHFRKAVLMLDGDTAASPQPRDLATARTIMNVEAIYLRPGVQPDQLASREIKEALSGHLRPGRGLER